MNDHPDPLTRCPECERDTVNVEMAEVGMSEKHPGYDFWCTRCSWTTYMSRDEFDRRIRAETFVGQLARLNQHLRVIKRRAIRPVERVIGWWSR